VTIGDQALISLVERFSKFENNFLTDFKIEQGTKAETL